MSATSIAAYIQHVESGAEENLHQLVQSVFSEHGPMPGFKVRNIISELPRYNPKVGVGFWFDRNIVPALTHLQQKGILGPMHEIVVNPYSKQKCDVLGLRVEHGAFPYEPPDQIEIKFAGVRYRKEYPHGTLLTLTEDEVQHAYRELFAEALVESAKTKERKAKKAARVRPAALGVGLTL